MDREQYELHARIEQRHWWFRARRRIMRQLIEQVVPPQSDQLIIDVGCGTGANIGSLADGYRCLGVDTSESAIRLATERFPQVEFRQGMAPGVIEDAAHEAQLWMLMDVLEHVPDDYQLLSTLMEAARPGAYFLLTVPAGPELWSQHDESFGHYRRYVLPRFTKLWQGLSVEPLLVSYFNHRLYPVVKAVRDWGRWRGHAGGEAGTDFRIPAAPLNSLLEGIFAGETERLLRTLEQPEEQPGYEKGVSLVALLRLTGPVAARNCPPEGLVLPELSGAAATEVTLSP